MKALFNRSIAVWIFSVIVTGHIISQPVYQANRTTSKLIIRGTSSLHDWTMEADNFTCALLLEMNSENVINIEDIRFSCSVKNIRSESNLMDKKAHNALREKQSPFITFRQTSLLSLNTSNNQISGTVSGILAVAGKTKQVTIYFTGEVAGNNRLIVSGTLPVKMSDFGVDPPTAMLGALKTGDAVTLDYSFEFNPDLTSNR